MVDWGRNHFGHFAAIQCSTTGRGGIKLRLLESVFNVSVTVERAALTALVLCAVEWAKYFGLYPGESKLHTGGSSVLTFTVNISSNIPEWLAMRAESRPWMP